MRRLLACFASLGLLAAGAPAQAQEADPDTTVEGVTIQGRRLDEAVSAFVAEIGATPRGRNLARWDRTVCVGVVNMSGRYAQALADQVSAVSLAIGLEIGEPGCRANILILADSDGDALARRLVDNDPQIFRPDIGNSNLGRDALEHFQTSGAPVRWWTVTQTVLSDTGETATGGASVRVRGASRIRSNVREAMNHVIVILDTSRIGTVSFASLADYVSMVALAQVDAQSDTTEFDTVLNLFSAEPPNPSARMTQWDLDYLVALYEAPADAVSSNRQEREIIDSLVEGREEGDTPELPAAPED